MGKKMTPDWDRAANCECVADVHWCRWCRENRAEQVEAEQAAAIAFAEAK